MDFKDIEICRMLRRLLHVAPDFWAIGSTEERCYGTSNGTPLTDRECGGRPSAANAGPAVLLGVAGTVSSCQMPAATDRKCAHRMNATSVLKDDVIRESDICKERTVPAGY